MTCPINLNAPDDCEYCTHGKLEDETYEYICEYPKSK